MTEAELAETLDGHFDEDKYKKLIRVDYVEANCLFQGIPEEDD